MSADDKATAKNRSPIKIAEEAIKANSGSKDGLPPVLNLGGGASVDAVDMISESIMSKIKMNTLNTALKMSEKLSNDAEAAVAPRSSVPGSSFFYSSAFCPSRHSSAITIIRSCCRGQGHSRKPRKR